MSLTAEAIRYLESGISVIPVDVKTKSPTLASWSPYQKKVMPTNLATSEWNNGQGIAVICGEVSGNLEIIDLDDPEVVKPWMQRVKEWNLEPILNRCLIEASQTKGRFHIAYRHQGKPDGNKKLAQRKENDKVVGMIETRGKGGYCIVAPTKGYTIKQGDWLNLPILTADERDALLAVSASFNEIVPERVTNNGNRVGDDYNSRANISEIITPLGWTRFRGDLWTRPGKKEGASASWNHNGNGKFVVFTTSTGLEPGAYDLFGLFARLCCGGDFNEAARLARAQGYGTEKTYDSAQPKTKERYGVPPPKRKWQTMDEVEVSGVEWLIPHYLPLGHVTLLYGDSGIGKSTATLAIAAGLSHGIVGWSKEKVEPCRTILLSAEDPADTVVKPRLIGLDANMKMIRAPVEFDEEGLADPMILDEFGCEELIEQIVDFGAKLVVIDPLRAYFDGENMNDQVEARRFMRRLTNIAIRTSCAIVLVHHVTKQVGGTARYRAAGSQDFFDACRSALMAVVDPEDETNCALSHEKHNLTYKADSIGYSFSKVDGFYWTGDSALNAEYCAVQQGETVNPKQKESCKSFIMETLERDGVIPIKELDEGAKSAGFTAATIRRAKEDLRGQTKMSQVKTDHGGAKTWYIGLRNSENTGWE